MALNKQQKAKLQAFNKLQSQSINDLRKQYEQLTKRANTRLSALERTSNRGKNFTGSNAYRWVERNVAKEKALTTSRGNKPRFSRSYKGLSKSELASRINTVQQFLEAETSTISGIKKAYRKGYNTLKESGKIQNMTFEDYTEIMESSALEHFKKNYYSVFTKMLKEKPSEASANDIVRIIENSYGKDLQEIDEQFTEAYGKSLIFEEGV